MESDLSKVVDTIKRIGNLSELGPDDELLDTGLISSIDIVDILVFVGDHFRVEFQNHDMIPANFRTARNILNLAYSYRGPMASANHQHG